MKIAFIYPVLAAILLLSGCGPRVDGSSEKAAKASFEKMKAGLSDEEQSKLDLAFLYITGAAMADKWDKQKEYKGQSFKDIVLKKINGKTRAGILNLGEECLKKEKAREIKNAQDDLDELKKVGGKKRTDYNVLKKQLSALQGRFVKMELENGRPVIYCEFKNVTANKYFDVYAIQIILNSIPNKSIITSRTASYSGVGTIKPQGTVTEQLILDQYYTNNTPEINWKDIQYPVTDLAKYGLQIEAFATDLDINDKIYSLNNIRWSAQDERDYIENIKTLTAKLKDANNKPDDLDDELKHGGK